MHSHFMHATGAGELDRLQDRAAGEGFLNRLFGLDCFSKAR